MHPIFAQALAPFAPPSSTVHDEAQALRQDLAYHQLKTSSALRQLEDQRALERQIREQGVVL